MAKKMIELTPKEYAERERVTLRTAYNHIAAGAVAIKQRLRKGRIIIVIPEQDYYFKRRKRR